MTLTHEFDSSRTCNYCGIAAERVQGNADNAECPVRKLYAIRTVCEQEEIRLRLALEPEFPTCDA